jgi:LacI family transcriptional regulator
LARTNKPKRRLQAATSRRAKAVPTRAHTDAPTIEHVAERAGVSMKTVSRVVNREAGVRAITAQRVETAIRELNYRPNIAARNLASPRAYLVALLFEELSDNYLVNIEAGARSVCEPVHYSLLPQSFSSADPRLVEAVFAKIAEHRFAGLIIAPPICDHLELIAALDAAGICYVSISPFDEQAPRACVSLDDRGAGRELTNLLIAHGHRRIAFIKGLDFHGAASRRYDGYLDAHREHGLKVNEQLVATGSFLFDSGVEWGRRLLSLAERPTAIFAANDDMAAGVLSAAHELGIGVPAQLSVAGFDDTPIARAVYPGLTTIRQPIRDMATGAAETVINALRARAGHPADGRLSRRYDYELIVRGSVGPAP